MLLFNTVRSIFPVKRGPKHSKLFKKRISKLQKKIGSDPEERKRRSERCKKQHEEGRIGRRNYTVKPRICRRCGNKFVLERAPSGKLCKFCSKCRPGHPGGNYKHYEKPRENEYYR